jgi:two-component system, OmpR family, sensor histidine kinase VicK
LFYHLKKSDHNISETSNYTSLFLLLKQSILYYTMHDHLHNLSREELIQLLEEKSEYLSLMIHQLRTPLTAQKWFFEMFCSGQLNITVPPERQDFINKAQDNVENALKLLRELSQSNHSMQWRLSYNPQNVSLRDLLTKVIADFNSEALAKHISINYTPEHARDMIHVDPDTFPIVFQNIIENAVKYSPVGTTISIASVNHNDSILISITDQGIGIPYDDQQQVFQKLYRSQNAKEYAPGTGLGLHIVKIICEHHNSSIWFESIPNIGSTFFVQINPEKLA